MYLIWWDDRVIGYAVTADEASEVVRSLTEDDPIVGPHLCRVEKVERFDTTAPRSYRVPSTRYRTRSRNRFVILEPNIGDLSELVLELVGSREWFISGVVVASSRDEAEKFVREKASELYRWCRQHNAIRVVWDVERDEAVDWTYHPTAVETYFRRNVEW